MDTRKTTDLTKIDSAWGACAALLDAASHSEPGEPSERRLTAIHDALERRRDQVAAGNTLAILLAISECADADLPLPEWLKAAFTQRINAFVSGSPSAPPTLDAIFSSPNLRSGAKRRRLDRAQWELGLRLWSAMLAKEFDHRSFDTALTAVLAEGRWPVKKTQARKLVLRIDHSRRQLTGGTGCLRFRT